VRLYIYVFLSFFLRLPPFAPLERHLESMLMERIEGLECATVRLRSSRFLFFFGLFRHVTVELRGLKVGGGMRFERLAAEGEDIRVRPWLTFFRGKARLGGAGELLWNFTLLEEDLEKYFTSKGPLLRGTKVKIEPERITLRRESTLAALAGLGSPLSLAGALHVKEDENIHLDLHQLSAFGFTPNRAFVQSALALINPIVKSVVINRMLKRVSIDMLEGFSLHNTFREIRLEDGHVEIYSEMLVFKSEIKEKEETQEN
jgi:hypothetical protein